MSGESGTLRTGRNEAIADDGECRDETPRPWPRSEALHDALWLSNGNAGVLSPVIQTLVRAVLNTGHDRPFCGGVGAKSVSDDAPGTATLLSQKPRQ